MSHRRGRKKKKKKKKKKCKILFLLQQQQKRFLHLSLFHVELKSQIDKSSCRLHFLLYQAGAAISFFFFALHCIALCCVNSRQGRATITIII